MKKNAIIFTTTIILFIIIFTYFCNLKQNNIYKEENVYNSTKITKGISMNLEQTAGAGDYKTVTQSSWPTEGYKFNSELSRCENGSTLSWDDTKKTVVFSGNVSDKCYVYFDKTFTLKEFVISEYGGAQGIHGIYYHSARITTGAKDNSYRYAGGDYVLTDAGNSVGATMIIGYNDTITTALIDYYCNGTKKFVGYSSNCNNHYFLVKGNITQYQTYSEALNAAVDMGYLTSDNIKNFVCFGTNESPCPDDNLYRIIGVIDDNVKIIKWSYATSDLLGTNGDFLQEYNDVFFEGEQGKNPSNHSLYSWNKDGNNTWSESELNTINLNTNYLNNIGEKWANKIATTTWKVGGNTRDEIVITNAKTAYQNEILTPAASTIFEAKVGLLYVSDYGFAASRTYWTYPFTIESNGYDIAKEANWLYGGGCDWTITPITTTSNNSIFVIFSGGSVMSNLSKNEFMVRPVFNLESSVTYVSGSGSMSDPIIIN